MYVEADPSEPDQIRAAARSGVTRFNYGRHWLNAASLLPVALAAFALLLRLHNLAGKPLWFDEILSLQRARLPLGALVVDALTHKHFPTYFLLLRPFASINLDAWALRLPSAVFGAGCVLLVTRLGMAAGGWLAGVTAGALMALSPLDVQFGQEARPYTLLAFLVLIGIAGLVRIAQEPEAAALRLNRPHALWGPWMAYLFGTLAALLVENNAIPWLVASNLAFAAIVHRTPASRDGLVRNWIRVQAVIALIWLPALAVMFAVNRGAVMAGLEWVPKPTPQEIGAIVEAVYMFRISDMMTFALLPGPLPQFGAAVALLALFGAWSLKAQPRLLSVLGLAFAAMPITIVLVSMVQPLWVPRYLLWSTGPYFLMAGLGAAALPWRLAPVVAAVATAGGAISLLPYYRAETKPRWDEAAAYLVRNAGPQDVIVTEYTSIQTILKLFAEPVHFQSKFDVLAWRARRGPSEVADGERRFIVYGHVGQGEEETEAEFRRKWSALGAPAMQTRVGTHILLLRFDKPPPPPEVHSVRLEPHDGAALPNRPMP